MSAGEYEDTRLGGAGTTGTHSSPYDSNVDSRVDGGKKTIDRLDTCANLPKTITVVLLAAMVLQVPEMLTMDLAPALVLPAHLQILGFTRLILPIRPILA